MNCHRRSIFLVLMLEMVIVGGLIVVVGCTTDPTPTSTPSVLPTPNPSQLPTPQAEAAGRLVVVETLESEEETNTMNATDFAVLLTAAAFLSLVANRLVEGLATPIFDKYEWDKLPLMYISWAVGCGLVVASGVNLFADIPGVTMAPALGLVLSGLVAGGGSNLLHELFGTLGQRRAAK